MFEKKKVMIAEWHQGKLNARITNGNPFKMTIQLHRVWSQLGRSGDGPGNARCTERNSWYPSFKDLCLWQMCIWTASLPCKVVYRSVHICYCYDITISVSIYFLYTYDYCIYIIIYILSYICKIYVYTIYVCSRYIYMQLCRIQIYDIYIYVSSFYANPLYLSSMSWPYTFYPLGQGTAPKIAPQPKSSQSRGSFPKKEPPDAASGSTAAGLAASFAIKKTGQGGWTLPETNSLVSQNLIFSGKFPNGHGECGDCV